MPSFGGQNPESRIQESEEKKNREEWLKLFILDSGFWILNSAFKKFEPPDLIRAARSLKR
jgi:hypothetical protein